MHQLRIKRYKLKMLPKEHFSTILIGYFLQFWIILVSRLEKCNGPVIFLILISFFFESVISLALHNKDITMTSYGFYSCLLCNAFYTSVRTRTFVSTIPHRV